MNTLSVFAASAALGGWVIALVYALVLLILAFEIWMFINVMRNNRISQQRRLLWAIGIVLIHPFVAIAYYFTDFRTNLPPEIA
jgi:hypothetical protein